MTEDQKHESRTDWLLNKLLPKKFIVFGLATVFVFMGKLDGQFWGYIAMAYLGSNALVHFATAIQGMKQAGGGGP